MSCKAANGFTVHQTTKAQIDTSISLGFGFTSILKDQPFPGLLVIIIEVLKKQVIQGPGRVSPYLARLWTSCTFPGHRSVQILFCLKSCTLDFKTSQPYIPPIVFRCIKDPIIRSPPQQGTAMETLNPKP